jgi:hypothetical protein
MYYFYHINIFIQMHNRYGTYDLRVKKYSADLSGFDPGKWFTDYDFYEVYDGSKNYTSDRFVIDYGHGEHTYEYYLHVFQNNRGFSKKKKFIVAYEILSSNEKKELVKYCCCEYHKSSAFWQVLDGCKGDDCVAHHNHYNPGMIKLARDLMAEKVSDKQSLLVNKEYSKV